ncbi:MAG TPA: hypothetical protein PKA41_15570 [Verrucomicrobiota bacterium]|nr:hypothetical protein [Verrucomicrobiota bacterium]
MKKIIVLILALLPALAGAQTNVTLKSRGGAFRVSPSDYVYSETNFAAPTTRYFQYSNLFNQTFEYKSNDIRNLSTTLDMALGQAVSNFTAAVGAANTNLSAAIGQAATNLVSGGVPRLSLSYTADGSANTNLPVQATNHFSGLWQPTIGSVGYVIGGVDQWRADPAGFKSFGGDRTPGRYYLATNLPAGFGMRGSANQSKDKGFQFNNRWMLLSDRRLSTNGVLTDGAGAGHGQVIVFSNANPTAAAPRWVETQKLQPPFGGAALRFGFSSSLDNTNFMASEIMANTPGGFQGRVHTYYLSNGSSWVYSQTLYVTNHDGLIQPNGDEEYGHVLRISGTNAAVGVLFGNTITGPHVNFGSGYVGTYWLSNGVWQLRQWVFNVGTRTNGLFGYALDLDDSGTNLFVNARDDSGTEYGKLAWFKLINGSWTNVNRIFAGAQSDGFGRSVSAWNGRMIVGAPSEFSTRTGAVHFITYEGTNWTHRGRYDPTDVDSASEIQVRYGWQGGLEHRGDISVVGVPWADSAAKKSSLSMGTNGMGKVHVFRWNGNSATLCDVLAPPDRQFGDNFGMQAFTDGTNVYAVSASCYRQSPTPTNYMMVYAYTNVPPTPPAAGPTNVVLLDLAQSWTLNGVSGSIPLSSATVPALGNQAASSLRWKSAFSYYGTFGYMPAGNAGADRSFNWSIPSHGKTNWLIRFPLLGTNTFTIPFAGGVSTIRTNGETEYIYTPSGGVNITCGAADVDKVFYGTLNLTRSHTNGTPGPAGGYFASVPGDFVDVRIQLEALSPTNIWFINPIRVESW